MTAEARDANARWSCNLFKQLRKENPDDNVFFSPISIIASLCMALAGARNKSEREMIDALCLSRIDKQALHSTMGNLLQSLKKNTDGVKVNVANKMYFDKTLKILPHFMNILQREYRSELAQVDFIRKYEKVREEINNWVDEETFGKIKEILVLGSLRSETKLILVNAVYFKGVWKNPFEYYDSYEHNFFRYKDDPNPIKVTYMTQEIDYKLGHDDELQCAVLELPFKGNASMVIILPDDRNGIDQLENKLTAGKIDRLMTNTELVKVDVHIPRFKLECAFSLERTLPALGMQDVFQESRADFSGIHQSDRPLYIGKIAHKACLEVMEEGAVVAAGTAVMMVDSIRCPERSFMANHPFLVALLIENQIAFFGSVRKPEIL